MKPKFKIGDCTTRIDKSPYLNNDLVTHLYEETYTVLNNNTNTESIVYIESYDENYKIDLIKTWKHQLKEILK